MLRSSLSAAAAALVLLGAGCGSENPAMLSSGDADALTSSVDGVRTAIRDGDCAAAAQAVRDARTQVAELPSSTSERLRDDLADWLRHIEDRVPEDCEEAAAEETPTPTPTEAPTEAPTPTETPSPTPTATPTETPTEEPAEPTPDPGTGGTDGDGGDDEGGDEGAGGEEAPVP